MTLRYETVGEMIATNEQEKREIRSETCFILRMVAMNGHPLPSLSTSTSSSSPIWNGDLNRIGFTIP